ncbi:MAG: GspH/FimT family pseudopilin [Gammaproteobacteria bacterium]|jgi:type IV fimbrial biogenesis protein FimT
MKGCAPTEAGFTLFELMISIVVLSVLLTVGVPTMLSAAEKRETISAAEEIYSQLQFARSESVSRSAQIFANISAGGTWAIGISDDPNCDPTDNNPACDLPDVTGANAITHLFSSADFNQIGLTTTAAQITFSPQRATATAATIEVASARNMGFTVRIVVTALGQISMCSPNTNPVEYVPDYRAC